MAVFCEVINEPLSLSREDNYQLHTTHSTTALRTHRKAPTHSHTHAVRKTAVNRTDLCFMALANVSHVPVGLVHLFLVPSLQRCFFNIDRHQLLAELAQSLVLRRRSARKSHQDAAAASNALRCSRVNKGAKFVCRRATRTRQQCKQADEKVRKK